MQKKTAHEMNVEATNASLLEAIIDQGRVARDPAQAERAKDLIVEFVDQVPGRVQYEATDAALMISERIAAIDALLSQQVNEILHHPEFQKLESAWRGLHQLVMAADGVPDVQIKALPACKEQLIKDFERAPGFDQSSLFKLIYEEEFGTLGGAPFGALVADIEFGRSAQDIRLLSELSHVAASAHAPLLAAAAPALFDLDSFTDISAPRDMAKVFESGELAQWRGYRDSEDSRYVALSLPRVLMRLPYGADTVSSEQFAFEENCDGLTHERYLWGSPSWSLAERIVESYAAYGWASAIRGVEGGGLVENLPQHFFRSLTGERIAKCPTETAITDRREKELSDQGFLPLCYAKGTGYAVFFGGQTTHRPAVYTTDLANANARLAAVLPYVLAASRFAHYVKAIMRDKVGSFQSRESVEHYLNRWIAQYVTPDDRASHAVKAQYPLREASVEVRETPGKPGSYSTVLFLRPHFQLEELTASIRLVAEVPRGI
ncbi:type VI secretion system contractile sheath large subunit [Caballeronia zhejiangensis]|uniref:type VI secretion system contractile sheath large subunit n=1 Tax=Caballeronia zhejiangensis TaxID=871203 RepID=UPI00158D8CDE|nr:type VI secretion system contractile sheath large subunit [Caballeronia zhejiangensis]